jgi:hypothetical protein
MRRMGGAKRNPSVPAWWGTIIANSGVTFPGGGATRTAEPCPWVPPFHTWIPQLTFLLLEAGEMQHESLMKRPS